MFGIKRINRGLLWVFSILLIAAISVSIIAITHLPFHPAEKAAQSSPVTSTPSPIASYRPVTRLNPSAESTNATESTNPATPTATLSPVPTYKPVINPVVVNAPAKRVPSQVVIKFAAKTTQAERAAYIKSLGGIVVKNINSLNTVVINVSEQTASQPLPSSPLVTESESDYYVTALDNALIPNDPDYTQQWALPAIGAPSAWSQMPANAPKVTIAVIDSGICAGNPDLTGRILPGWDFVENDAVPQDDYGHGCEVSGVIAANMNDGIGIAGVAPNAQIMPLRVLDANGVGSYSNVAAAIVYAADNGAQVINMSLGGSSPSSVLQDAVTYAASKGVILVAAAGNNGTQGALYPAAYDPVIAVGSVDPNLQPSSFSNYGPLIDIWAPGRDILTTKRDGSYGLVSGTSFAAPYVAGAEAVDLVLAQPLGQIGGVVRLVPQIDPATPSVTATTTFPSNETPTAPPTSISIQNDIYGFRFSYPASWRYFESNYTGYSNSYTLTNDGLDTIVIYVNKGKGDPSSTDSKIIDATRVHNVDGQNPASDMISFSYNGILFEIQAFIDDQNFQDILDFLSSFQIGPSNSTLEINPPLLYEPSSSSSFPQCPANNMSGCPAWGSVLVSASSWNGVDVFSNGGDVNNACSGTYGYNYQCVELAQRFFAQKWVYPNHWNVTYAYQMFDTHPGDTIAIANGGSPAPVWGDALVFGGGTGGYGHVAVITSVSNGRVYFAEENWGSSGNYTGQGNLAINGSNTIETRGSYYVRGWIHSPKNTSGGGGGTCYTLALQYTGSGNAPTASPSNSSGCSSGQYHSGESINLTPYPASGWHLDHWDGTDSPSSNHLTMPASSKTVTANYSQNPPNCPQSGGVILYWNANYDCNNDKGDAGYRLRSSTGWQNVNDGSFNDKASSVRVPSGWSVMLYVDADRGGGKVCYNTNISDFGTQGYFPGTNTLINDQVSSMEVFSDTTCGGSNLPSAPSLSSPGNGSSNAYNYDLNFQWNSVSNATGYLIEWWGGTYNTMQPCGWTSSTSCHIGTVIPGYTYSWHVKAHNNYGESDWSPTWTFTIQAQPTAPSAPSLSSPGNGSSNPYNYDLTFQWNSTSGANDYLIEWWGGPYSTMQPCGWTTSTSCHIGTVSPGYTYSWHVKARNGYGESGWSSTWTFTIQPAPLPDLAPYPRPGASDPIVVSLYADSPYQTDLISGQSAYFYWGFKNIGQSDAGPYHTQVLIDGQVYIDYPDSGLGAGNLGGQDNWRDDDYIAPGWHTLKIITDAYNQVAESNENNNVWTGSAYWRAPTVQVNSVFTTDDLGPAGLKSPSGIKVSGPRPSAYKDTFNFGDPINLYLDINNDFQTSQDIQAEWEVLNPAGRIVPELSWSGTISIDPGDWWWSLGGTIPTDIPRGVYTFNGRVTYNGVTTEQTTTFTVTGSPAVEVYDAFVTDANGNATSLGAVPKHSVPSDIRSKSTPIFNAGDGIQLYIDTYNDVADNESATFDWQVIDPWGRDINDLEWNGDLSSPLGDSWWDLSSTIPTDAITGDYTFTGYITYGGRTTQQSQVFHVNGPAGPLNDNFGVPTIISAIPYYGTADTWGATTPTTDPTPSCTDGQNSNSVWYKYMPSANGILHVDTYWSDYDTVVAVWTGTQTNLTEKGCNDDDYDQLQSWLEVPVTGGTTYYIEVMDYGDPGGGNLELNVDFAQSVSNDDFNSPVTITVPYSLTNDVRGATQASDDPALTNCNRLPGQASVWYKYTPTISGQLALDTIGSDYDTMLAVWSGTRGNLTPIGCNDDIGDVNGDWDTNSTLSVQLIGGTTYYIEVSNYAGMIDVNGASATGLVKKDWWKGSDVSNLQDLKSAVEKGKASVHSQGNGGDIYPQFWGGQLQFHATYHPVPGAFNKGAPSNSAVNQSLNPTLSWGTSSNADSYEYCYDTTNDNTCSTWASNGTSTSVALSSLNQYTTYYWHVRAVNSLGTTYANGSNTAYWSFTTGGLPGGFGKIGPVNVAANQPLSVTLSWGASSNATSYEYCYDMTDDSACSTWTSNGTSTSKVLSGLSQYTTYYWHVRAVNSFGNTYADGSNTAYWSFTTGGVPGAFEKIGPANVATNQPLSVTLNWGTSSNATSYEYCYDMTNDNACSTWTSNGASTSKVLSGLGQYTTYYWHVRAVNSFGATYADGYNTAFWLFTTGGVPGAFGKIGPANVVTNQPLSLTLSWGASNNANSYEYCYDITNDNACTNWISTSSNTSVDISGLSMGTIYYWQVRANNSFGTTYANGSSSAYWSFTTGNVPVSFNKSGPANGVTNQPLSVTLNWGASSNATSYEYCYDMTNDNACSTWTSNSTSTSFALSGLSQNTTYYWHVRANNNFGTTYANGSSTAFWSFTTGSLPGPFGKSTPANGTSSVSLSPTLTWASSSGAANYAYCYDTTNDGACTNWVNASGTSVTLSGLSVGTTYYWQVRAVSGAGFTYADDNVYWSFTTLPLASNDNFDSPIIILSTPFQQRENVANATTASDDPTLPCVSAQKYNTVWYRFTAPSNGVLTVNTIGSDYDTVLGVWKGSRGSLVSQACNDDYSNRQSQVSLNVTANNTYQIEVAAYSSPSTTYDLLLNAAFAPVPSAFSKIAPINGSVNNATGLTLSWGQSGGAASYQYCYDATNDNVCSTWIDVGTNSSANISGLNLGTTYYWQVRAVNSSGQTYADGGSAAFWSFTTGNAPGAFVKSNPVSGATNQPLSPTLSWGASSNVASYEFCFDTTNDNACTTWISAGASTSVPLNGLSPYTTYYWHVRANNTFGTTYSNGSGTAFWSFTTGGVPGAFGKSSPANLGTNILLIPSLSWESSVNATSYEYCYDTSNDDSCDGDNWVSTTSSTVIPGESLMKDTTYYWQVRATNSFGTTYANGGSWWSFTTTINTYAISGNAGIGGATLTYTGGSTSAGTDGGYTITVPYGWNGTVTPSLAGYVFIPDHTDYSNLTSDQVNQNYTASVPTTLDDNSYSMTYQNWSGKSDAKASGGGYHYSSTTGQTAAYTATANATSITLLTYKGPDQGKVQILVDNVSKGTFDLYNKTALYKQSITVTGLLSKKHTITVKVLGQKNSLSKGTQVRLDAFKVGATTIEDNNIAVTFASWIGTTSTSAYGGKYRSSNTTGASITFTITGDQFHLVTARGTSYGMVDIYKDGVYFATYDLYNPVQQWQYQLLVSGLGSGTHTIMIQVKGVHNAASTGNMVVFDAVMTP